MFRGRIKITGEIANFSTFKDENGRVMVRKNGTLQDFNPEEVENVEQAGWRPASELPPLDKKKNSKPVIAICGIPDPLNYGRVLPKFSAVVGGVWTDKDIKWWCYPPEED